MFLLVFSDTRPFSDTPLSPPPSISFFLSSPRFETHREKTVSNTGKTRVNWVVGSKEWYSIDALHVPTTVLTVDSNAMVHTVKVSCSGCSVFLSWKRGVDVRTFLKAVQPIMQTVERPGAMMPRAVCCCCGVEGAGASGAGASGAGASFLPAPAPTAVFLPAPFYIASKKICTGCFEENAETGRRELAANAVSVRRRVGEGVCHSQMKMWCDGMASSTVLPRGGNLDSFKKETKARCVKSGIAIPAQKVDLFDLGKRKKQKFKRGVDGRREDTEEWRRQKEANYVPEKFVVKDLENM